MKFTIGSLLLISSFAMATTESALFVCKANQGSQSFNLLSTYKGNGKISSVAKTEGVELKTVATKKFHVLEGFGGSADYNVTLQLTVLNSESENMPAVLVKQSWTERGIGYETEVTQMTCSPAKSNLHGCIANEMQSSGEEFYSELTSANIDSMLQIPEMAGHIAAVKAAKVCNVKK